jgi:hypothetical protein
MLLKVAALFLVAAALGASPAGACMGPNVLVSDNFQSLDPAWTLDPRLDNPGTTFSVAKGYALLTALVGDYAAASYESAFFDSADACVEVISPAVADASQAAAGIMFGESQAGDFYVFAVEEDGKAAILHYQSETQVWDSPLPWRAVPGLKTGANVTTTLRVTWSGTSVTAFINGAQLATVQTPQFQNTMLGIWCEGDPGTNAMMGTTYQFANFKVTNVP